MRTARRPGLRCASACALSARCALPVAVLVAALLAGGCGPGTHPDDDGGGVPGDAPGAAGRVELTLTGETESLEDDVVVEIARLGVAGAHAHNDRGDDLQPSDDLGTLDLVPEAAPFMLEGAVPAAYGRVTLELGSVEGAPSFELRLTEGDTTIHVIDDRDVLVDARCDAPAVLGPGGTVVLTMELELGEVYAAFRELPLPPPDTDGVIVVRPDDAPEAIEAIEDALRERWELSCAEDSL